MTDGAVKGRGSCGRLGASGGQPSSRSAEILVLVASEGENLATRRGVLPAASVKSVDVAGGSTWMRSIIRRSITCK